MNHHACIPQNLVDSDGHVHLIERDAAHILLDGALATIECVSLEAVTLRVPTATIRCDPASFWQGLAGAGATPTPIDCGMLLASLLMERDRTHQLTSVLRTLRSGLECALETSPLVSAFPWPSYRFDALTAQALAAYDGSSEMTQILARLLKQPEATIEAWAALAGKAPAAQTVAMVSEAPQIGRDERRAQETVVEKEPCTCQRGTARMQWTAEMVEHLKVAWHDVQAEPTTMAKMRAIALRTQWPLHAIQYKVYELGLPRQDHPASPREPGERAETEEDRSSSAASSAPLSAATARGGEDD